MNSKRWCWWILGLVGCSVTAASPLVGGEPSTADAGLVSEPKTLRFSSAPRSSSQSPRPHNVLPVGDEASLAVLKKALTSTDYSTRLLAVEAVGESGLPALVSALEPMLGDPEHDVRVATVDALSSLGTGRAADLLRSVRDDETEALDLRAVAASALLHPFPHSPLARRCP